MASDPIVFVFGASIVFALVSVLLFRGRGLDASPSLPDRFAGEESARVGRLFVTALGVRIGVSMLISMFGWNDYFAPDRWGYEDLGRTVARSWQIDGIRFPPIGIDADGTHLMPYHYYNAAFFFVVGEIAPWFVRLMNCTVGACAVLLVHRIAKSIYGPSGAEFAAKLVCFMPSLVLWSALNIRDAWAFVAIAGSVLAAIRLREEITLRAATTLLASLTLLGLVRGYMFLIIAAGILLSYGLSAIGNRARNVIAGGIAGLVFIYLYNAWGFGRHMVESASWETLSQQREALATGGSAFYQDIDISSPEKALTFLPIGTTFFLFAPFPWLLTNSRQLMTLPEMLVWWFLAVRHVVPGIRLGLRARGGHMLTLLCVAGITVAAYGLVEGNVGTAYRHRAQILPLLLVLAAGSVAETIRRREEVKSGFSDSAALARD